MNTMETKDERIKNAMNVKVSDETKNVLVALAAFEDSFWKVCEELTEKSENDETQEIYCDIARKRQKKARESFFVIYREFENLLKEKMSQTFLDTDCREI